jgi:hypothetical protein
MLFKNSVRTSKRTPHFTITEINWLTLFKFNSLYEILLIIKHVCGDSVKFRGYFRYWVPGVLSAGVKRGRSVTLTTHPHLVQRSWMSRSCTPLPPALPWVCSGTALPFTTFILNSKFFQKGHNSIQFNSIQFNSFFILTCWLNSYKSQLQSQHTCTIQLLMQLLLLHNYCYFSTSAIVSNVTNSITNKYVQ